MCATFRKFGLEITIEANKKAVQFLNVEFHLETSQYRPFLKTWRYTPLCKCIQQPPPSILKNIPEAVNRRLSNLSSDEEMFRSVTPIFQEALNKAGYKFKLTYKPQKSKNQDPKTPKKDTSHLVEPPIFKQCENQHWETIFQTFGSTLSKKQPPPQNYKQKHSKDVLQNNTKLQKDHFCPQFENFEREDP